jgi:hypothetical protein
MAPRRRRELRANGGANGASRRTAVGVLRGRRDEDESDPETPTTEVPGRHSWSSYADHFTVVVRQSDEREERQYASAVVVDFGEVGADVPIEELVPELESWLGEQRGDNYAITTFRSHLFAGGSAVNAQLVISLLGTVGVGIASQAIYDGMIAFVKSRLARSELVPRARARLEWLRNEEPDDAVAHLTGWVASALDRRRSELSLVEFAQNEAELRAVYDVGDDRYEVRLDELACRIDRIDRTA